MVPSERTSKSPIGTLGDIRRERETQDLIRVPSSEVDKQMGAAWGGGGGAELRGGQLDIGCPILAG
jgi:hypothetical protein